MRRAVILSALLALLGCGAPSGGSSAPPPSAAPAQTPPAATAFPIDHVFIIWKENHTYDNYFASFPGGDGALKGKDSQGRTVPLVYPPSDRWIGGSNDWDPCHRAWDQGGM